jgi:hypothetical protein
MSLWLQALDQHLNFKGNYNPKDNAKTVFAFLSMGVPRDWWERALNSNSPIHDSHVYVLVDLYGIFKEIPELTDQISYKHLAAIAFADERHTSAPFWGRSQSELTIEDYIKKTNEILAEQPDIANLCKIIESRAKELAQIRQEENQSCKN